MAAIKRGLEHCVKALLTAGADPNLIHPTTHRQLMMQMHLTASLLVVRVKQLSYLKFAIAAVIVWAKGALRVLRAAAHMTDIVEYA